MRDGRTKVQHSRYSGSTILCETEPVADVQLLWMVSNSDTTSPFWFQDNGSCTAKSLNWLNATGSIDGAAFEVADTR